VTRLCASRCAEVPRKRAVQRAARAIFSSHYESARPRQTASHSPGAACRAMRHHMPLVAARHHGAQKHAHEKTRIRASSAKHSKTMLSRRVVRHAQTRCRSRLVRRPSMPPTPYGAAMFRYALDLTRRKAPAQRVVGAPRAARAAARAARRGEEACRR